MFKCRGVDSAPRHPKTCDPRVVVVLRKQVTPGEVPARAITCPFVPDPVKERGSASCFPIGVLQTSTPPFST